LPFSCRERTAKAVKIAPISRAKRSAGTAGWAGWPPPLACSPHERTTLAQNHASTTRLDLNHLQHTIRLGITGFQHHGPSNHACTTSTGTTSLAQRAFVSEIDAGDRKRNAHQAAPAAQRLAHQPRRTVRPRLLSSRIHVSKTPRSCRRAAASSCMRWLGRAIEAVMLWLIGILRADTIFAQVDSSHANLASVFVCILKPHEPMSVSRDRVKVSSSRIGMFYSPRQIRQLTFFLLKLFDRYKHSQIATKTLE